LKVLITLEDHLWRGDDGCIYGGGPTGYPLWTELLDSFEQVVILARVGSRDYSSTRGNKVDGPAISVQELPDYVGPWNYLLSLPTLRSRVRGAVAKCDAYLLRVPGLVGRLAWKEVNRLGKPFAAEVMSDPSETMGRGAMPGYLRFIYRTMAIQNLGAISGAALATLYWSNRMMPQRYPSANNTYTCVSPRIYLGSGYASPEEMGKRYQRIKDAQLGTPALHIGFIGSFAQFYKGPDVLLQALAICLKSGNRWKTSFVGEGRYLNNMESLSRGLSVERYVKFLGQLDFGSSIYDFLYSIDLFVMPSRSEGLSRALVEAMSRGCPCIGSNVGGIPELLAPEDLVPPNNSEALAEKITEVTADPARMKEMSERNLARAKQFDPEALLDARLAFYRYVRDHSGSNAKSGRKQQSSLQPL
jgi:glycosyltransferase involved in cell wall biosynthesis